MENSEITKDCKWVQQLVVMYSSLMLLVFIFFLIFQYSGSMLLLAFIEVSVTILLNLFLGRIYGIRVENQRIIIENMWRKIQYPLSDLKDIRPVRFIFPYPLNPYLKFIMKNDKTYISVMKRRLKAHLTNGGVDEYIRNLQNTLFLQ